MDGIPVLIDEVVFKENCLRLGNSWGDMRHLKARWASVS